MFLTPRSDGFPPIINGHKTRFVGGLEEISPSDWLLIHIDNDHMTWLPVTVFEEFPKNLKEFCVIRPYFEHSEEKE